jgi:hypothetical protein
MHGPVSWATSRGRRVVKARSLRRIVAGVSITGLLALILLTVFGRPVRTTRPIVGADTTAAIPVAIRSPYIPARIPFALRVRYASRIYERDDAVFAFTTMWLPDAPMRENYVD